MARIDYQDMLQKLALANCNQSTTEGPNTTAVHSHWILDIQHCIEKEQGAIQTLKLRTK